MRKTKPRRVRKAGARIKAAENEILFRKARRCGVFSLFDESRDAFLAKKINKYQMILKEEANE